jgi:hypothetical protein
VDEATRNLVANGIVTAEQAERLRATMNRAFPEALVTGYEPLVAAMPNEPDDRHVTAAAVKSGAQVIVTSNLKHFQQLPEGIEAQSPDHFLCNLFDLDRDGIIALLREQASALKKPPITFEKLLDGIAKTAPEFVAAVRECLAR